MLVKEDEIEYQRKERSINITTPGTFEPHSGVTRNSIGG